MSSLMISTRLFNYMALQYKCEKIDVSHYGVLCSRNPTSVSLVRWIPSPSNSVKINFDGVVSFHDSGIGFLIRDHKGRSCMQSQDIFLAAPHT